MVTYGAVLVAIMVLRPQGILGYKEFTFGGLARLFGRRDKTKTVHSKGALS
jgi:thiosulfate reductase cytochrome b subunit